MRVIIDAGHGGTARAGSSSAFGSRGPSGTLEKEVTLDIARHVVARLGAGAALTRAADTNLTLGARAQLAAQRDADVFVSIHANSGPPEATGPETFVHPEASPDSHRLADGVQRALERLRGRYGGVAEPRNGPLAVLSPRALGKRTSACLVEVDYLSNPRAEARLRNPQERAAIGAAIASAIQEHVATRRRPGRALDASEFDDADQLGASPINVRLTDKRAVSTTDAAKAIVAELDSWTGTSPWQLDRAQVAGRLRQLIATPTLYAQSSTPLCGPAAFYSIWTLRDPAAFARHAVDLYKTGRAQIGTYAVAPSRALLDQSYTAAVARAALTRPNPSVVPPMADWMLMGAIRNTEDDIFVWDGSAVGNTLSGITFPQEVERWLSATGVYRRVDNRIGTGASALSSKGWDAATALVPQEGTDIVCLIQAGAYVGLNADGNPFPNHYVILTGRVRQKTARPSPDGSPIRIDIAPDGVPSSVPYDAVSFPCWSFGNYCPGCYVDSMQNFVSNFYGAIVAEMPTT